MTPLQILVLVLLVTIMVTLLLFFAIPFATKKGWPVGNWLTAANTVVGTADTVLKAIDTNPAVTSVPELIVKCARNAVIYAEKLWQTGQLAKTERKQKARDYIEAALKTEGIELTDALKLLIDGAIESTILLCDSDGMFIKTIHRVVYPNGAKITGTMEDTIKDVMVTAPTIIPCYGDAAYPNNEASGTCTSSSESVPSESVPSESVPSESVPSESVPSGCA
jgi:hypothetical protein